MQKWHRVPALKRSTNPSHPTVIGVVHAPPHGVLLATCRSARRLLVGVQAPVPLVEDRRESDTYLPRVDGRAGRPTRLRRRRGVRPAACLCSSAPWNRRSRSRTLRRRSAARRLASRADALPLALAGSEE